MKYSDFRQQFKKYPYFSSRLFAQLNEKLLILRRQLVDWLKQGKVIELKRGLYTLNADDRTANFSRFALANVLYPASYVSLASALSHYQLIPEQVGSVTSVTSKKTQSFQNSIATFSYQHIKQPAFNHFIQQQDEFGLSYYIATPEKALVDFLYFQLRLVKEIEPDWFETSLRLQNLEGIDMQQLKHQAALFNKKNLTQCIILLEKTYA